ncbi:Rab_family GTPase [Hexamita inflata]|uniref:Rab_family GTPase n=1 Tax=Hexamita inflata TaxID=28002 RepID=A0ABP1IKX0_9EUKA
MTTHETQRLIKTKFQISVTLIGSMSVGKSTLIQKLVYDQFCEQKSTINPSCSKLILNGIQVRLWDTAGQEQFRSFTIKSINKSNVIFIVCDSTDEQSIKELYEWFDICDQNKVGNQSRVIIATKTDLPQNSKLNELIFKIGEEHDCKVIFCSSKNGQGISDITDLLEQVEIVENLSQIEYVEEEEEIKVTKKGCCQ